MLQMINQPTNGQLGTILQNKLSEETYNYFVIVSAFAKNSGVLRMKKHIQAFREIGGKVDAFIGIDAHGTSYEALCNLLPIIDNLYIIHDNNPAITFHSKVYYLTDQKTSDWIAIGSNNLTGGGLWTNHECATIVEENGIKGAVTNDCLSTFRKQIEMYKSGSSKLSLKINDITDLDILLDADLIRHEIRLQIDAAKARQAGSKITDNTTIDSFGFGKVSIPRLNNEVKGEKVTISDRSVQITSTEPIEPSDDSEKMWFETRAMTGGSRNILDLSMLGSVIKGSGKGTRYDTNRDDVVLGSVAFFDIDPTNTTVEKDITINYKADDYCGCTIKMHLSGANPNGSWRIQLKGETASGDRLTFAGNGDWLVHKVIVLEKIRTDYYVMSVLAESELDKLKAQSIFVACNGNSPNSKQYGLLDI